MLFRISSYNGNNALIYENSFNEHVHKLEEYPIRDDENWLKHIEFKENIMALMDHM